MKQMPMTSVRGRVRSWVEANASKLGDDVLEVGSRMTTDGAWWIVNRDLARGQWTGMDMQSGHGVDFVGDIMDAPVHFGKGRFSAVLCSEVLEHVQRPWLALPKLREVIRPGGHIIITTLTSFPVHGFPDDYWRFTESGLRLLLEDAGFKEVVVSSAGNVQYVLNDHGEPGNVRRDCPMHVFGVARC